MEVKPTLTIKNTNKQMDKLYDNDNGKVAANRD